jgi:hypothetical protein
VSIRKPELAELQHQSIASLPASDEQDITGRKASSNFPARSLLFFAAGEFEGGGNRPEAHRQIRS